MKLIIIKYINMKIKITNHAIKRTIQRVNKITNWVEARDYLLDKFKRLHKWENVWWTYWCVKIVKQEDWNYFMWNYLHRFIYNIVDWKYFLIITYHIFNQKKQKKYINGEFKRIEELFKV